MNTKWFVLGGFFVAALGGYVLQRQGMWSVAKADAPSKLSASGTTRPFVLHTATKPANTSTTQTIPRMEHRQHRVGHSGDAKRGVLIQKVVKKTVTTHQHAGQEDILIQGGEVWTAAGKIWQPGDVLVRGGKIVAVGPKLHAPGAKVIQAQGYVVTPGLIDTHSHMGVYASPGLMANADGNESTRAVTAHVWAEHSFWAQDPALPRAMAGGVTTAHILPGSANLIGGRTVTIKLKPGRSVEDMKFPHAPSGLKMACGENPKRVHRDIATRMGSAARFRQTFQQAKEYQRRWERYHVEYQRWLQKKKKAESCVARQTTSPKKVGLSGAVSGKERASTRPVRTGKVAQSAGKTTPTCSPFEQLEPMPPARDAGMETLGAAFAGKILVHVHCYRADDMLKMLRVTQEFGLSIRVFHHAVEAYKIRDVLAKQNIGVAVWADWWGFKLEAFDGIQENAAMAADAGVLVSIHSDSALGIQRLNHEAGKAFYRGRAMGLNLSYDDAIRWITKNPAMQLGIGQHTGSLEPGKMADLVLWDGHPFRVRTRTHLVMIDGQIVFQRNKSLRQSDFELGLQLDQSGMFAAP